MTRAAFIAELKALGYEPTATKDNFVVFDYPIQVGRFAGQTIKLGLQVLDMNPPTGPQVSPRLLPLHSQNDLPHPTGGVHTSPLGDEWEYWSRPYSNWNQTNRSARTYMAHITRLFDFS